ncbi:MAG: UPF0236 family transposase-like protein, partial [Bryobacteraceae bacterium]
FEESSLLLDQLAAVTVDPKQVERHAEALGREVADDEKQDVTPMEQTPLPPTLYLGIDGTGIPVRAAELVGRSGKQADGTAKTREVKLCTVWSAEARDEEGHPMRDRGSVSYSAAIESAATPDVSQVRSEFTERVLRETSRRRFCQAERAVVIGDGAPWIWNIAQELFPKAIRIVDRFHVKQHLSDLSKALHPAHPARARLWAQHRHDQLDDVKLAALLGALRPFMNSSDEARKCYNITTFAATATECVIRVSIRWASALPPAWSRLVANSPSAHDSNGPECTGRYLAPTQSLVGHASTTFLSCTPTSFTD